jgi:peptidoglycan/LPS O-acetylase OafA/YrhL
MNLTLEVINLTTITVMVFSAFPFLHIFFRPKYKNRLNLSLLKRKSYIDFLKGIAIIAVVLIHVTYFYYMDPIAEDANVDFFNFINNISRFAIAFFFILSGMLLSLKHTKKINFSKFYSSKIIRILIPYSIFTIFIALVNNYTPIEFFMAFISGGASPPYYFISVLFQFYLLFPILNYFKDSRIFLIISFFVSFVICLMPWYNYFLGFIPGFMKFLFFFVYGMYMRNYIIKGKIEKKEAVYWLTLIFFYILLAVVFTGHYYNGRLIYAIAVFNLFIIFKDIIVKINKKIYSLVQSFGNNSLWVFLIHFPIVNLFYLLFSSIGINFYITFFSIFVLSLFTSYCVSMVFSVSYNKLLSIFEYKKQEKTAI